MFRGAPIVAPTGVLRATKRLLATMASETAPSAQAHSNGTGPVHAKKAKLHGRAFYESIGSPKLILAPMVEQSEFVRLVESVFIAAHVANTGFHRPGDCSLDLSYRLRSRRTC